MTTDPKNLLGATIAGRFRIERTLGEGGMGAVFEATQTSLGRRVAIKVIKPHAGSGVVDDDAVRRFERETAVIARLNHPNVVQVVDGGRSDDGTMFLAMELVDGENVRAVLQRDGAVEVGRALAIAEDVCAGLAAAHDQGVIHRDLKAENVMLVRAAGRGELAKVLDFGVAKMTTQAPAPAMTGSGFVVGTPGSIAPEQMLGRGDDARSDLYAVGVLLFEMLAGQPPFSGATTMELMMRHLSEPAPRVDDTARLRGRQVPVAVVDLVAMLLEKEPVRRPADARALVAHIAALRRAQNETLAGTPVPPLSWPPQALPPGMPSPGVPFPGMPSAGMPSAGMPSAGMPSAGMPLLGASPTPLGSRLVALPPGGADVAAAALVTATSTTSPGLVAPIVPSTTSSTQAAAPSMSPALAKRRFVHRAATLLVVATLFVMVGGAFVRRHESDRLSKNDEAEAELERAVTAFEALRIDEASAAVDRAIALDPDGAAMAYLLRADLAIVSDRLIEFADADNARARTVARKRRGVMALETDTERLARSLTILDPDEARAAFEEHAQLHSCTDATLHQLLFATRLTALDRSKKAEEIFAAADADHEHLLTIYGTAVAQVRRGDYAAARALVDAELLPRGGGNNIVEMLVAELEMREGMVAHARERLRAVVARAPDWRARLWLDGLDAADNRDWYKDVVTQARKLLPTSSPLRPNLLQLAGHALAGEGRMQDASTLWEAAIDESNEESFSGVHKAATISLAQIFSLHDGDPATAERWRARYDADLAADVAGDNPGAERARAYNIVAGLLADLAARQAGVASGKVDLAERVRKLENVRQDVPHLHAAALWHLNVANGKLDVADDIAAQIPRCWGLPFQGITALLRVEAAHKAGDESAANAALAMAETKLDAATTPAFVHECTANFNIFGFLQRTLCAHAAVDRAQVAQARHDDARVARELASFDALWPHPDPNLPLVLRAASLRAAPTTTSTTPTTTTTPPAPAPTPPPRR